MYTEDLVETHAVPVLAILVTVRPYEPCLANSVGHILLISSTFPDSYSLHSPSSVGLPNLLGEGPKKTSNVSVFGDLHPLTSSAEGSHSGDDWALTYDSSRTSSGIILMMSFLLASSHLVLP